MTFLYLSLTNAETVLMYIRIADFQSIIFPAKDKCNERDGPLSRIGLDGEERDMDRRFQAQGRAQPNKGDFKNFRAAELYCARCRRAMPTRERLLLVLLDGELLEYLCIGCGSSLGTRRTTGEKVPTIIT